MTLAGPGGARRRCCHLPSAVTPLPSTLCCHPSSAVTPLPSSLLCRHPQLRPCLPCTPRCYSSSPAVFPRSHDFPHEPKEGTPQHTTVGTFPGIPKTPHQDRMSRTAGVPGPGTGWARCRCCGEQSWPCLHSRQGTPVPRGISGCSGGRAVRGTNGTRRRGAVFLHSSNPS